MSRRRRRYPEKHRKFLQENRHLYDTLLEAQGGVCYICGQPPKLRKLHMDHDHKRMVLRGLLCFRCNAALRAYMTVEWLERAAAYLRTFTPK